MNAAVRAVVRMGIYVGCEVYLIREVSRVHVHINETRIGFCTGAGAVKSRGKTAGVLWEREERPLFILQECREWHCLLRESRGTGSKRHSPPAGPGVTPGSLVGLLLLVFGLYLPLSLYLSCFRFSVHGGD